MTADPAPAAPSPAAPARIGTDPLARLAQGGTAWIVVAGVWLVIVLLSVLLGAEQIRAVKYADPDDAMRIVQVRDLLAGQGWFDVTQYRAFPPEGTSMHWSRLVDIPLAGAILLLRPLLGPEMAELAAAVGVPLLTLGVLVAALFWAMRGPFGVWLGLASCLLLIFAPSVLYRLAPLRVDHHGWQIALAALVLGGLLHRSPRVGGIVAGVAMALSLRISSEGLPLAAITGAIMTLRQVLVASEWRRLELYMGALVATSAALLIATQGAAGALSRPCDAFSIVYLAPLAALAITLSLSHRMLGQESPLRRALPALFGLGAAAVVFVSVGGDCLGGPFAQMDPLVHTLWYRGIAEGMPVWTLPADMARTVVIPALPGLIGLVLALILETDQRRRLDWLSLLLAAVGTFLVALLVARAMSVAHIAALPGTAWLLLVLLRRIYALGSPFLRVPLALVVLLLPPGAMILASQPVADGTANAPVAPATMALERTNFLALRQIGPGLVFSPVDLSPEILLETGHSVVATGHHRNQAGIGAVIRAFTAGPEEARAIVQGTGATYLLLGPGTMEAQRYRGLAPDGLSARLAQGEVPPWLVPVRLDGLGHLLLFRVQRP